MARTEAGQVRTCGFDFTSPRLIGVGFLTIRSPLVGIAACNWSPGWAVLNRRPACTGNIVCLLSIGTRDYRKSDSVDHPWTKRLCDPMWSHSTVRETFASWITYPWVVIIDSHARMSNSTPVVSIYSQYLVRICLNILQAIMSVPMAWYERISDALRHSPCEKNREKHATRESIPGPRRTILPILRQLPLGR